MPTIAELKQTDAELGELLKRLEALKKRVLEDVEEDCGEDEVYYYTMDWLPEYEAVEKIIKSYGFELPSPSKL